MTPLQINYLSPAELIPFARNARKHSAKQIEKLVTSIQRFGFNNPILLASDNSIIAGHGRVLAARKLGMERVPTIQLDHLSDAQKRAYILADNKLAELAGWDEGLLALELEGLLELDVDFEITDLGFEMGEIDHLIEMSHDSDRGDDADVMPDEDLPSVARPGDLWVLGNHMLFCGDALDRRSYEILLGSERAVTVITDPPYNVTIAGNVSGLGKVQHREFAMASGEMSPAEFSGFLNKSFALMAEFAVPGSIHFVFMDWRHWGELLQAGQGVFSELKNLCVWVKPNGGMGSLYRSRHELVAVFKSGGGKHINNVNLGGHGRNRTNVWEYPGMNGFQHDRERKLAMHPTLKPVALVADAILDCTRRKDIVLDPFGGSGTTILSAQRIGRRARVIELDPHYVDVSLDRFFRATGIQPVNLWTGRTVGNMKEPECSASEGEEVLT